MLLMVSEWKVILLVSFVHMSTSSFHCVTYLIASTRSGTGIVYAGRYIIGFKFSSGFM